MTGRYAACAVPCKDAKHVQLYTGGVQLVMCLCHSTGGVWPPVPTHHHWQRQQRQLSYPTVWRPVHPAGGGHLPQQLQRRQQKKGKGTSTSQRYLQQQRRQQLHLQMRNTGRGGGQDVSSAGMALVVGWQAA
jgi:hypothetical protein